MGRRRKVTRIGNGAVSPDIRSLTRSRFAQDAVKRVDFRCLGIEPANEAVVVIIMPSASSPRGSGGVEVKVRTYVDPWPEYATIPAACALEARAKRPKQAEQLCTSRNWTGAWDSNFCAPQRCV